MRQAKYKRSLIKRIINNFISNEDCHYSFAAGILFGAVIVLYLITGGN